MKKEIKEFREKFGNNSLLQQSKQKDLYKVNQIVEKFLLKALTHQKKELGKKIEKEIKKWFDEFMVDKVVREDVIGITCLEDLLKRLRELLKSK